jgi:hypothetical protein
MRCWKALDAALVAGNKTRSQGGQLGVPARDIGQRRHGIQARPVNLVATFQRRGGAAGLRRRHAENHCGDERNGSSRLRFQSAARQARRTAHLPNHLTPLEAFKGKPPQ